MRCAQQQAADFAREHGLLLSTQGRFIDLISEVGELGKELLKATGYETEAFVDREEIAQEMGDCLFSLLCLCSSLGLDAQEALELALQKYEERFAQKGHIGSGETI